MFSWAMPNHIMENPCALRASMWSCPSNQHGRAWTMVWSKSSFWKENIELQRDWHFESSKLHTVQHKSSVSKSHLGLWSVSGTLEILPGEFLIEEPSLSLIECCQLTDNVNVVECTHKGVISYCWIMLWYSLNIWVQH